MLKLGEIFRYLEVLLAPNSINAMIQALKEFFDFIFLVALLSKV
jgi:hypothetical protein